MFKEDIIMLCSVLVIFVAFLILWNLEYIKFAKINKENTLSISYIVCFILIIIFIKIVEVAVKVG